MAERIWDRGVAVCFAAVLVLSTSTSRATTTVTYCGQSFRGRGVLAGDLDCGGFNGHAVIVQRGKLDLNGFTIRGAGYYGVHCESACQIRGPGTITENGFDGVHAEKWVIVHDTRVINNGLSGVFARNVNGGSRVVIKNSTITGNGLNGIEADNLAVVRYSNISNNSEYGVDVGVQYCDTGGRAILVRSIVSGNGFACPGAPCADLNTCGRNNATPRLRNASICGSSHVRGSGEPGQTWGICSQD